MRETQKLSRSLILPLAALLSQAAAAASPCEGPLVAHDSLQTDIATGTVHLSQPVPLSAEAAAEPIEGLRAVRSDAAPTRLVWASPGLIDAKTQRYLLKGNPTFFEAELVDQRVRLIRAMGTTPMVSPGSYDDLVASRAEQIKNWIRPAQRVTLPVRLETARDQLSSRYGELEFVYDGDQLIGIRHRALAYVEDADLSPDPVDAEGRAFRLISRLDISHRVRAKDHPKSLILELHNPHFDETFSVLTRRLESVVKTITENLSRKNDAADAVAYSDFESFTRARASAIFAFSKLSDEEQSIQIYTVAKRGELPYWDEVRHRLASPEREEFLVALAVDHALIPNDPAAYARNFLNSEIELSDRLTFQINRGIAPQDQAQIPFLTVVSRNTLLNQARPPHVTGDWAPNAQTNQIADFFYLPSGEIGLSSRTVRIDLDHPQNVQTDVHDDLILRFTIDRLTSLRRVQDLRAKTTPDAEVTDRNEMIKLLRVRLEPRMAEVTVNQYGAPAWQETPLGDYMGFSLGQFLLGSILTKAVAQRGSIDTVALEWLPHAYR